MNAYRASLLASVPSLVFAAPENFVVNCDTSKGALVFNATRSWSPLGADRFYELVAAGFYDDAPFFRMAQGFVIQFGSSWFAFFFLRVPPCAWAFFVLGLSSDPVVNQEWRNKKIKDDEVKISNTKGTVVFAHAGTDTRTTQLFINLAQNTYQTYAISFSPTCTHLSWSCRFLNSQGFSPFAILDSSSVVLFFWGGGIFTLRLAVGWFCGSCVFLFSASQMFLLWGGVVWVCQFVVFLFIVS